jgi:hypothetical protein
MAYRQVGTALDEVLIVGSDVAGGAGPPSLGVKAGGGPVYPSSEMTGRRRRTLSPVFSL